MKITLCDQVARKICIQKYRDAWVGAFKYNVKIAIQAEVPRGGASRCALIRSDTVLSHRSHAYEQYPLALLMRTIRKGKDRRHVLNNARDTGCYPSISASKYNGFVSIFTEF